MVKHMGLEVYEVKCPNCSWEEHTMVNAGILGQKEVSSILDKLRLSKLKQCSIKKTCPECNAKVEITKLPVLF